MVFICGDCDECDGNQVSIDINDIWKFMDGVTGRYYPVVLQAVVIRYLVVNDHPHHDPHHFWNVTRGIVTPRTPSSDEEEEEEEEEDEDEEDEEDDGDDDVDVDV